jgi:uncharacterized membrane protein (DUF2068 family)
MAERANRWLTLIGIGKLLKAAILLAVGVFALRVSRPDDAAALHRTIARLGLHPGSHFVHDALERIAGLDPHRLQQIGLATFVYAALFLVEGVGLLTRQRWAEYFTVVITGSFVPLEVYEVANHFTPGRLLGLALNVAAVAYLVHHLRRTAHDGQPRPRAA